MGQFSTGFVYLLEAKKIDLLKIGFSSNVKRREKNFACYAPSDISLGEWFREHRSIRKFFIDLERPDSLAPVPFEFFRSLIDDESALRSADGRVGRYAGFLDRVRPKGFVKKLLKQHERRIPSWRKR